MEQGVADLDAASVASGHKAVAAELLATVPRVESGEAYTTLAVADDEQSQRTIGSNTSVETSKSISSAISNASMYSHVFIRSGSVGRKVAQDLALLNLVSGWQATGAMSLFDACRRNNVERVKEILAQVPHTVNMVDFGGNTPLQLACMLRCYEVATVLIEQGGDLLRADPIGIPPLQYVKEAVHKAFLQRTADMFAKDDDADFLDDDSTVQGNTNVIRDAAYRGDGALIEELLNKDPSLLHAVDKKGHTPLIFACMGQQIDTACFLLERGADLYAQTTYGWQADRFIRDKWHREKVLTFAFKVSPEGRAQAAAAFQKRKDEVRMALQDTTYFVMEGIRGVIKEREQRLRLRAEALTEKALERADHYLVVGELRAVEHSIREYMDDQERLAELERLRLIAEEEERVRQREAFIAASVQAVKEQRAREAAERAEAERQRLLAEEEAEKLRFRLELAAKAKAARQAKLIAETIAQAEFDYAVVEAELKAAAWSAFNRTRPLRMKLYRRSLKSTAEGMGCKLPEVPAAGLASLQEEVKLERKYAAIRQLAALRAEDAEAKAPPGQMLLEAEGMEMPVFEGWQSPQSVWGSMSKSKSNRKSLF